MIPARLPLLTAHQTATGKAITNGTPARRHSSVGVYRAADRAVALAAHNGVTTVRAALGAPGDVPPVGHWNGPGVDTVGYYRPSTREFFLPGPDGTFGTPVKYGNTNDIPVVGDWSGAARGRPPSASTARPAGPSTARPSAATWPSAT
ncbi:hypothetical protein ABT093_29980 [Kitasatospora sp. NPDC002551]|uniref:hypothetical protein n=1 Tax=unclassified Kitasatospora TaxID=2633591 RepID=UPI0033315C8B